jgi:hypothetical protein
MAQKRGRFLDIEDNDVHEVVVQRLRKRQDKRGRVTKTIPTDNVADNDPPDLVDVPSVTHDATLEASESWDGQGGLENVFMGPDDPLHLSEYERITQALDEGEIVTTVNSEDGPRVSSSVSVSTALATRSLASPAFC